MKRLLAIVNKSAYSDSYACCGHSTHFCFRTIFAASSYGCKAKNGHRSLIFNFWIAVNSRAFLFLSVTLQIIDLSAFFVIVIVAAASLLLLLLLLPLLPFLGIFKLIFTLLKSIVHVLLVLIDADYLLDMWLIPILTLTKRF